MSIYVQIEHTFYVETYLPYITCRKQLHLRPNVLCIVH